METVAARCRRFWKALTRKDGHDRPTLAAAPLAALALALTPVSRSAALTCYGLALSGVLLSIAPDLWPTRRAPTTRRGLSR